MGIEMIYFGSHLYLQQELEHHFIHIDKGYPKIYCNMSFLHSMPK